MFTLSKGLKNYLDKRRKGQTEDTVESTLVREVEGTLGGMCIKVRLLRGFPDRICLLPGGICDFIELKHPHRHKFEPLQKHWHALLRKLGFRVHVLYNKEQVYDYVRERTYL